tara:strand:- start:127 stop:351 length:225 start_codon:yes stop_codon:yes gene_type:complete
MDSSLALGVILTFVGIIVFILISKNDLGVTTLKKDPQAHTTLIGSMAKGIPGTDILSSESVSINKESTENALHN